MTGRTRSLAGKLIKLGGLAVLVAAGIALVRGGTVQPGHAEVGHPDHQSASHGPASTDIATSAIPELVTYLVGYALALALTAAAFALVYWHWAPPATALWIVFALALVQIIVHFRCFLHVTLDGPARDDLQLVLFSTLIVLLMVGGTLIVLFNLRLRMM